ncbi:hypothetical protein C5Z25_10970 [Lactobacillus sp. CBA3605]|uniref:DUF1659 domain-containing protein n=1 Tax=Lactobacillus sp. CBA3605 TaxID=2099788 RepID=UPI000CFD40EB|nr:hypothetical protein [Lactobacillus sp. CBA3605]AVK62261.1 hypothetical protein C5Z25_10970 [Lactobacillus sp. CBA3605]
MNKIWKKSALAVELQNAAGETHKQLFTAIVQDATDAQLTTFSKALETLTAHQFVNAEVIAYYEYNAVTTV